jgi:DNA-binding transcriptional MerR regulator
VNTPKAIQIEIGHNLRLDKIVKTKKKVERKMLINEVERTTGITKKNIRFYEDEGLLSPRRDNENKYRNYSDEDVRKLQEIKLFRKLGISIADIKKLQDGSLTLSNCMEKYAAIFNLQLKELEKTVELCNEIKDSEDSLMTIDVKHYITKIEKEEENGIRFRDIVKDYLMSHTASLSFEPEDPILNHLEFVQELEHYANSKGKALTFLSLGMMPRILLDGKRYVCMLEVPRMLNFPFSIFFTARSMGFKWVYLYEDNSSVEDKTM